MFFEPKACWQHIDLSERSTAIEFAEEMGKLVDLHYPEAEKKITVDLDNLNTYTLAVLRGAFEPPPGSLIGSIASTASSETVES